MTATRRLVLLRHGLTDWNAERRYQGQADVGLNETGVLQAKAAAVALVDYDVRLLWSSDLGRARSTAEELAAMTGLPPAYDARLREVHVGEISGLTHPEVLERFGPGPHDYGRHGGESEEQLGARVRAALEDAAAALGAGETGVVVSHGHALRTGLGAFFGWPAEVVATLGPLGNCGWIELVERATAPGGSVAWRLAAYNRVAPIS